MGKKKPQPTRADPDVEVVRTGKLPTSIQRVAMFTATKRYRFAEEFFFWGGGLCLLALMIVEVLHRAAIRLGSGQPDHAFPSGILIGATVLVAPKLIGRVMAGRALGAIAGKDVSTGTTGEQEAG